MQGMEIKQTTIADVDGFIDLIGRFYASELLANGDQFTF